MAILTGIHGPDDVKKLSLPECAELATEIRQTIIDTVSRQGGHLASNLGNVELTIALHRAFHTRRGAAAEHGNHAARPAVQRADAPRV